ncbi:MAG: transcriptional regulator [Chloroflexi bacterium]|nr:MAG: transcriptional regulator [Chloroflexota bacterium]
MGNGLVDLKRGPGPLLDYLPEPDGDRLAEMLVAFANTDGGTILVGVDREGRPTGQVYPEELEGALQAAEARCTPPVQVSWEQAEVADGAVIAIHVPRSPELHSLDDGRVLVRAGTENRPLTGPEIRHLAATKSSGDFEAELVAGAGREDLDEALIAEYLEKRAERGQPAYLPVDDLLVEIGATDEVGHPTVAGLLLFGRNPQAFLPQSGLVFVRFVGTEPRGEDGLAGYGRREEIGGSLARIIERTWEVLLEEMHIGAVVKGLEREERLEYPPFAVREALVNAVCHRDYRLRGRRIEVRKFADRLEVISPGGLPGYITLDNIVEEHFSRNPRIVGGLYYWGYIEELGLGVDRMIEEMTQAGHPPPRFRATPYSFTVTLSNLLVRAPVPAWARSMNERQAKALAYVQEHGRITNREYRQLCPDVSAETLRLDLADLVKRGILLKVGAKRGTYYILK